MAARLTVIGAGFDLGNADVVCFQEVFTYWHLRLLARQMRSFGHVSFRRSAVGPAGGLVTSSRLPVAQTWYQGFGVPPDIPGIPRLTRLRAGLKGTLVTRLAGLGLTVVNTHPAPNRDGDWSEASRFYPLHDAQLGAIAGVANDIKTPTVVCGDFNVNRDSSLFAGFLGNTGLSDAFGGDCRATFHAEYLPAGKVPHCIDFILTSPEVRAEAVTVLYEGKVALPGGPGYVSDHIGLSARLLVPVA